VLVAAGASIASEPAPTLTLRGGHGGPAGTACGAHPTWRYYSPGSTVIYKGHVPVGSASAMVRVVVERCYPSGFRVIDVQRLLPHDGGRFGDTFVVNVRSDCFVQATYRGRKSARAYFRVR
jgi:hypothetical protein